LPRRLRIVARTQVENSGKACLRGREGKMFLQVSKAVFNCRFHSGKNVSMFHPGARTLTSIGTTLAGIEL
jgi:hypothetical protein